MDISRQTKEQITKISNDESFGQLMQSINDEMQKLSVKKKENLKINSIVQIDISSDLSGQFEEVQKMQIKPTTSKMIGSEISQILSNSYQDHIDFKGSILSASKTKDASKIAYKINIIGPKKYHIVNNKDDQLSITLSQKSIDTSIDSNTSEESQKMQISMETIQIQNFIQKQNAWQMLDQINKQNPSNETTYMIYRQILNMETSFNQFYEHQQIKKKIESLSKQNFNSPYTVLLGLEQYLRKVNPQMNVIFCQKPTLKSQISLKVISTGYSLNKFKCQQIMKKDGLIKFQDLANDQEEFIHFQQAYKRHLQKKYQINLKQLKIASISKLQKKHILIEWDTYEPQNITNNEKALKKIKITPYFTKFFLCIDDFDMKKGNINFFNEKNYVQERGNWPYYQPIQCSRFSIKVQNKFDSGNNKWLGMKNIPLQWPSSYFGLQKSYSFKAVHNFSKQNGIQLNETIQNSQKDFKSSLKNIKLTLNQQLKTGIIVTPHVWNALKNTQQLKINQRDFILIFQCRIDPRKLEILQKQQYWCVKQPSDIRPYGIILIQKELKDRYPSPDEQFGERFSLLKYGQKIQKTRKQLNETDINK